MDEQGAAGVVEAVLLDYPLRVWARQQEHSDGVLREFRLLLGGELSGTATSAPQQLVSLAQLFSDRFGPLVDELTAIRQARLDAGDDRMDWRVPLPPDAASLMRQVDGAWAAVDAYCLAGDLLALSRPPDVAALQAWSTAEIIAQSEGAEPNPWRGPF